jgi:4,5-dihydroxyphthalate decarboxylase
MARSQGLAFTAIPVFSRRLFSQSHIWTGPNSSIGAPQDLIDRKVGVITFQTTLSVQAKGDLQTEYGVPWRDIQWHIAAEEPIEFIAPPGLVLHRIPEGRKLPEMSER